MANSALTIEDDPAGSGLKRVAAYFRFVRPREIQVDAQRFLFAAGEAIRLFFSWRHTPALVRSVARPARPESARPVDHEVGGGGRVPGVSILRARLRIASRAGETPALP